jgi:hypothetical protein
VRPPVEDGDDLKSEQVANALSPYHLERISQIFFDAFGDERVRLHDFLEERFGNVRDSFRLDLTTCSTAVVAHAEPR